METSNQALTSFWIFWVTYFEHYKTITTTGYLLKSISLALSENLVAPGPLITPNSTKFIIRKIETENGFQWRELVELVEYFSVFVSMFHSTLLKRHGNRKAYFIFYLEFNVEESFNLKLRELLFCKPRWDFLSNYQDLDHVRDSRPRTRAVSLHKYQHRGLSRSEIFL